MKRKITNTKSIFKYERSECPVCMEEMSVESRSVTSPCMHEFCLECIGKWLTESSCSLCPLCKQSVKIIIYNIQTPSKYSKINFPKGFNNAWLLRKKTRNILDNFENILYKIYDTIRTYIYGKRLFFDSNILIYLVYFGDLLYRIKSSSTTTITPFEISDDEPYSEIVEKIIRDRLLFLFTHNHLSKILREISEKNLSTCSQVLNVLQNHVDPIRYSILELEIKTTLQLKRDQSLYLEYYVPGDHEHIVYSNDMLIDDSTVSAMITRTITTINFDTQNKIVAAYQITNIDNIFALLDYICSYEKLLSHLALASYYFLLSTSFYSPTCLIKVDLNMSHITISSCDLLRHCFREEELDHFAQTLCKFDKQLIFFEPLIVDNSEPDVDESDICPSIYIELSDSDDDALEIVSINRPVFDLTESVDSDDDSSAVVPIDDFSQIIPAKQQKISNSIADPTDPIDDLNDILEIYQSSTKDEPTTSTIPIPSSTNENRPLSVDSDSSDNSLEHIDCPSGEDTDTSFIYQPRSVNDFYDYLMSKNVHDK